MVLLLKSNIKMREKIDEFFKCHFSFHFLISKPASPTMLEMKERDER